MHRYFLHPEYLWLAPLVALPIIIHLLNRIRYRRVRWAAIEFLLTTERRAVRRARLQQLLLMALRMLLLAAALGALLQPRFRGTLATLLGGSRQVAVLLDASASMSATGAGGSAFERGKRVAAETLRGLPRAARATSGAFARSYRSPFRQPLQDRDAVVSVLEDARRTGGRCDVPRALRAAAESLERGGGGGTLWLLTDLQASGWRADQPGEWEQAREALARAGKPQVVITDLSPHVESNLSIADVRVSPAVLVAGDAPKLTATVELRGAADTGAVANVGLFLEGRRIDARSHEFREPGKADVVFRLPPLKTGVTAGHLQLNTDALPADDRFHFLLRTAPELPVLLVDGAPSSTSLDGAVDFVAMALRPPEGGPAGRSVLSTKTIRAGELSGTELAGQVAVVLADVPRLEPEALERLRGYVAAGGLLIVFPGAHTDVAAWNDAKLPDLPIKTSVLASEGKRIRLGAVQPTSPIVATLPAEGLDRVLISRLFRFDTAGRPADVLIHTASGDPFLVRLQAGRGKVYVFAVSAQADFSTLPFTPPFLLTLHRAMDSHLVGASAPLARPVFSELKLSLPPGTHQL
ncbi:BatA domain-containing protein, partial [bacterium]|nr:BatA domain-containing protein [bacterium]